MSVAKFVAANGREALRVVREAMGPDAVVLSNRTVEGGVEIVAMRDEDLGAISGSAPTYVPPPPPLPEPVRNDAHEAIGDLRGELQSMRALIERQLSGVSAHSVPVPGGDPLRESLFAWLVGAGFSGQLARTLLTHLPVGHDRPAAMSWIRQEIARKVPVLGDEDALFAQGGVLALIGPTGVGKTTTTAKLAARFVLRHGPEKLALLTTDSFRIGAHEQLRIYGDILGVPVHAVKDAADLRFALAALADKHLVIVDTVGMSQRDRSLSDQIAMLAGVQAPLQRVLLLNGASHGDTLNEVVHAYRHDASQSGGIDGCIISKLDEATHLGSVLDVVIRHRLPVFYASTGQRVPEHLELANGEALVERAFLMPRRGSVFADAQAARVGLAAAAATPDAESARGGDDVLRSITDSANAVGDCIGELQEGNYGFDLLRALWEQREPTGGAAPSLQSLARQVRESVCRDVARQCERHVLALTTTAAVQVAGRRAPQAWQHTLWLADRDGLPLAATAGQVVRGGHGLWDAEISNLRAAVAATRTVVNVHDGFPAAASIARWQQDGQRWLAAARKTTRVVCGGSARKLDALAETLTFHAHGDAMVRGRDAVQWLAQASVRVLEGAVRGARGAAPEGGVEAGLLVSRAIDRETGQTLSVDYVLCDPALAGEGARVVQWARWAEDGDTRCRTLRHALDHLGAASHAGTAEAQACANLIALQAGVTALRLEGASTQVAVAFLARLAGRSAAKGTQPGGAALVEGIGRLLALLDVLENYPGRKARVVQAAPHPAPQAVDADAGASHRGDALRVAMAHPPTHAEAAQHLAQRLAHHGQLQASAQAPASASPTSTFVPVLPQLASLGTES